VAAVLLLLLLLLDSTPSISLSLSSPSSRSSSCTSRGDLSVVATIGELSSLQLKLKGLRSDFGIEPRLLSPRLGVVVLFDEVVFGGTGGGGGGIGSC
jgi:hypothetical protein